MIKQRNAGTLVRILTLYQKYTLGCFAGVLLRELLLRGFCVRYRSGTNVGPCMKAAELEDRDHRPVTSLATFINDAQFVQRKGESCTICSLTVKSAHIH